MKMKPSYYKFTERWWRHRNGRWLEMPEGFEPPEEPVTAQEPSYYNWLDVVVVLVATLLAFYLKSTTA